MSIHDLIRADKFEEIKALLKNNPEQIFVKEDNMKLTPLHVAVQMGSERIIKLLLDTKTRNSEKSVDNNPETNDKSSKTISEIIDIPDEFGNTAFHYACLKDHGSYLIHLLFEYGANIDSLDGSLSTGLYNIISEVDVDDSNNNSNTIKKEKVLLELDAQDKAKLLLKLGANCNIVCSGKTPLQLVDEKNLSGDWWTVLLDVGAGLYADFSNITVNIEFLRAMTDNQIVIGATKDGIPVTRATPGFEKAITTEEELRSAIYQGKSFQYKALITSAKHLAKLHPTNTLLVNHLTQMIELFTSKTVKNMEEISINYLVKNFLLDSNTSKIPPDLLDKCKAREEQVLQQVMRGGAL